MDKEDVISHIIFIHSSIDGRSDSFHIWAIVSNAAMNIEWRYLFYFLFSFPLDMYL